MNIEQKSFSEQFQRYTALQIGAGFFCSQLALATHGMTDAVTWGMVRPAPLVWVIWGTISTLALFYLVPRAEHT